MHATVCRHSASYEVAEKLGKELRRYGYKGFCSKSRKSMTGWTKLDEDFINDENLPVK